ncbi:MAG TPA: hypothetical protein IGS40_14095 [Trichormus sp. M33_DOE_039]|nr:hypothetical protein [Trichormus sp. M33_DOE_039]
MILLDLISNLRESYTKVISIILALLIIGFSVVDNYGISLDEAAQIYDVQDNINLITKGQPIPGDSEHYGIIFNLVSEAIFQVSDVFSKSEGSSFSHNYEHKKRFLLYRRIQIKHYLTFLLSLVTYLSVAGVVGILSGLEYVWIAPLVLAIFPRFWGHSFFNPKDIPFAAMYTLGTFTGACLISYYFTVSEEKTKIGINYITLYSALYGILIGLVTGTRTGGFILLIFVPLTHILTIQDKSNIIRLLSKFWKLYILIFIVWIITTTIIHPASWSHPIKWFFGSIEYLSKHSLNIPVLFNGEFISSTNLPISYLSTWFLITTPEFLQILFLLGLLIIFWNYKKYNELQKCCVILTLLQILFLPTVAIINQSTIYDGIRQFLFIIPGIAIISAIGLTEILTWTHKRKYQLAVMTFVVILFGQIILDMITLHPYEYIYFNRIFGGLPKAHNRYETDYWGLSMREGMEWINNHTTANTQVASIYPMEIWATFAAPNIQPVLIDEVEAKSILKPFYYLALPRWNLQQKLPECKVVHQIVRQGIPLTIVKKCE